ncbi:hypothetical protein [Nocardia sp. MW-W600-9]
MAAGFQGALHAARARAGEGLEADVEFELLAEERGAHAGGGDLGRDVGAEFGDRAADHLARQLAGGGGGEVAERAGAATEETADRAADGTAEGGQAQIGQAEFRQRAVAVGELDEAGGQVGAALLQSFERGAAQGESGGGFGGAAGQHAGDQLPDRYPDRDLSGDSGRGARHRADSGPRGEAGHDQLGRGDDHGADDHQLGVLDVVGAVVE